MRLRLNTNKYVGAELNSYINVQRNVLYVWIKGVPVIEIFKLNTKTTSEYKIGACYVRFEYIFDGNDVCMILFDVDYCQ